MRVAGDLLTLPAKVMRNPDFLGGGNARVLWGGVLVSVLCFGLALQNIRSLCAFDGASGREQARAAVIVAAYPFALYFSAPYTEGLTLVCLTGTVLALRRGLLLPAALLGILTGLARSNGWTLSIALLAVWMIERRHADRRAARFLVALCPLAGLGAFPGVGVLPHRQRDGLGVGTRGVGRDLQAVGFLGMAVSRDRAAGPGGIPAERKRSRRSRWRACCGCWRWPCC